jgi:hypothetical protein
MEGGDDISTQSKRYKRSFPMKNLVAAMLIGTASVAAFAQVQVTAPQVQVTTPKVAVPQVQVTTPQATPMQGAAMSTAHVAGNSEVAHAEHKRSNRHHKKAK